MITLTTEQAQQIEEALAFAASHSEYLADDLILYGEALATIRTARAQEQAEQEPVAVVEITYGREPECYVTGNIDDFPEGVFKLYAAPVQQAEQEPVATLHNDGHWTPMKTEAGRAFDEQITRLSSRIEVYTAAPPRECKECAAKQAEIDRLMLEYCPDEMTPEQVAEWAASQRPVSQEPIGYLDESDLRGLVQGNAVWLHPENQGRMVRVYTAPQPGGRESVVLHKVVADHIKDLRACVPALEVYADELEAALNPSLAKSAAQESVALKEARRIAAEYAEPDSQVDSGNLYWALCEALKYATPEGRPDR